MKGPRKTGGFCYTAAYKMGSFNVSSEWQSVSNAPVRSEGAISVWWPIHKRGGEPKQERHGPQGSSSEGLLPSVCGLTEEEMFIWTSSLPKRSQWTVRIWMGSVQQPNSFHRDHAVLNQQKEGF